MDLQPLGEQVGGGLVVGPIGGDHDAADGAGDRLVAEDQLAHHLQGCRDALAFGD